MKLLVVTEHFWPEQFRITDLAGELVARGHQVDVLTGMPSYPLGRYFDGFSAFGPFEQVHDGVRIWRVPIVPRGRGRGWELVLNYGSYVAAASLRSLLLGDGFDAIVVFQPSPVTTIAPALLLRGMTRAPVAVWVQDLWPETLRAAGVGGLFSTLSGASVVSRHLYRASDLLLAQSRSFQSRLLALGIPAERVDYLPNWAEELFERSPPVAASSLGGSFEVMFAGNMGRVQGLETVIRAATRLKGRPGLHWTFVGDGPLRGWAQEQVERSGITSQVSFLGRKPVEDMPGLYARASAMLVSLNADETMSMVIPSKLQSYLAAGRPVLGSLNGEGNQIIHEAGAGFASAAEDDEALAANVVRMAELSPDDHARFAASGRDYYMRNFQRKTVIDRFEMKLAQLIERRPQ